MLLRFAKEAAVLAGDAETALEAVDRIIQTYEVDPVKMKLECLEAVAEAAKSSSQRAALAEQAFPLIDEAAADDNFEAAAKLADLARQSALRARDFSLAKEVAARMKEVEELEAAYGQYQKAMERLKGNPTDPEANLAAGRYLCVVKRDWDRGVPMLALGSDPGLKAIATQELKGATSPEAQVALGDSWWDLADTKEGEEKTVLLLRAGYWYRQAEPHVASALVKAKLERQLAEIGKLGRPIGEPPGGPPLAIAPFDEKQAKGYQLRWSRHLRAPITMTNSIGMKLVLIPPGEFDMGSSQAEIDPLMKEAKQRGMVQGYVDRLSGEGPRHRVRITRPFYLGMCEVTQAGYQRVMGANPSQFKGSGSGAAVGTVSWNDAQEFCRRLSDLPKEKTVGNVYQLPTEAQWEYACRAGTTTRFCFGDDERQLGFYAWFVGNSGRAVHPVGEKMPNAWGVYDMHGNVWEWCADGHGADYYRQSPRDDPTGPASARGRVLRGGSWADSYAGYFRSAYRAAGNPRARGGNRGFRVALPLTH